MRDYQEALQKLNGKMKRKLKNNTWLEEKENGDIAVRLHRTDVVTFKRDGAIVLDSGGWKSLTTKSRLNEFSPFSIWQKEGDWYIKINGKAVNYDDGIIVRFNLEACLWVGCCHQCFQSLTLADDGDFCNPCRNKYFNPYKNVA